MCLCLEYLFLSFYTTSQLKCTVVTLNLYIIIFVTLSISFLLCLSAFCVVFVDDKIVMIKKETVWYQIDNVSESRHIYHSSLTKCNKYCLIRFYFRQNDYVLMRLILTRMLTWLSRFFTELCCMLT